MGIIYLKIMCPNCANQTVMLWLNILDNSWWDVLQIFFDEESDGTQEEEESDEEGRQRAGERKRTFAKIDKIVTKEKDGRRWSKDKERRRWSKEERRRGSKEERRRKKM